MDEPLRLFADYSQIHVLDEKSESGVGEGWPAGALTDRVSVTHDALAVRAFGGGAWVDL
jgi:hypothetical protein